MNQFDNRFNNNGNPNQSQNVNQSRASNNTGRIRNAPQQLHNNKNGFYRDRYTGRLPQNGRIYTQNMLHPGSNPNASRGTNSNIINNRSMDQFPGAPHNQRAANQNQGRVVAINGMPVQSGTVFNYQNNQPQNQIISNGSYSQLPPTYYNQGVSNQGIVHAAPVLPPPIQSNFQGIVYPPVTSSPTISNAVQTQGRALSLEEMQEKLKENPNDIVLKDAIDHNNNLGTNGVTNLNSLISKYPGAKYDSATRTLTFSTTIDKTNQIRISESVAGVKGNSFANHGYDTANIMVTGNSHYRINGQSSKSYNIELSYGVDKSTKMENGKVDVKITFKGSINKAKIDIGNNGVNETYFIDPNASASKNAPKQKIAGQAPIPSVVSLDPPAIDLEAQNTNPTNSPTAKQGSKIGAPPAIDLEAQQTTPTNNPAVKQGSKIDAPPAIDLEAQQTTPTNNPAVKQGSKIDAPPAIDLEAQQTTPKKATNSSGSTTKPEPKVKPEEKPQATQNQTQNKKAEPSTPKNPPKQITTAPTQSTEDETQISEIKITENHIDKIKLQVDPVDEKTTRGLIEEIAKQKAAGTYDAFKASMETRYNEGKEKAEHKTFGELLLSKAKESLLTVEAARVLSNNPETIRHHEIAREILFTGEIEGTLSKYPANEQEQIKAAFTDSYFMEVDGKFVPRFISDKDFTDMIPKSIRSSQKESN